MPVEDRIGHIRAIEKFQFTQDPVAARILPFSPPEPPRIRYARAPAPDIDAFESLLTGVFQLFVICECVAGPAPDLATTPPMPPAMVS